jgi:outer membrane immunogenic protein
VKKTAAAASALALGALTTPAHAEEPATEHDWTGFYVGGAVAWNFTDVNWDIDGGEGFASPPADGEVHEDVNGAAGTLRAGYNGQSGPLVVGAEIDYSLMNFEENARFDGAEGADLRTKMHGYGSVRGRIGYAVDNVLCFATAGVAFGDIEHRYNSDGSPPQVDENSIYGWVAGGGVEVAVASNVSIVVEGSYASFEARDKAKGPFYTDKFEAETNVALARVGVNVAF